jgi:murein DD-endopeptidase MepM/ murein hydrolase activator NlpD
MLITDTDKAPVSIRFSKTTFHLLKVLAVFIALAVIIVGISYTRLLSHSMERTRLAAENEELKRYNAKVDQLEKNLEAYRVMLKRVTELAGINLSEFGIKDIGDTTAAFSIPASESSVVVPLPRGAAGANPVPSGLPVSGYLSRSFRPQDENPKTRHFGVDIAVHRGTIVKATADGEVTFAGWDETFGWKVVMRHLDGVETMYGHNDSLLVTVGDIKHLGDAIALSGSTGISTAPHVHYEVRKNGQPINPESNNVQSNKER